MTPSLDTIVMAVCRLTDRDDGSSYLERCRRIETIFEIKLTK